MKKVAVIVGGWHYPCVQETIKDPINKCLDYEYFDKNRERLLNIIPLEEALKL